MKNEFLVFACITCLAGNVFANATQNQASIQKAAENFMAGVAYENYGREASVKAGHLDSRLRLAECDMPLEAYQPDGGRTLGNTTVGVRCTGSKPWTLYVPVKVSLFEKVVVAARPLQKGKQLEQQDMKMVKKDLSTLRSGYYSSFRDVLGKQLSRTITIGAAITTLMVKNPRQVKRGQTINLVAKAGGLRVQMKGKALADGSTGELIQVMNLSSERIVEGTILSTTTVQINL